MDYFDVCQRMRAENVSNEERLQVLKMCISQGIDVSQLLYDTYDALISNHEALKMLASDKSFSDESNIIIRIHCRS